MAFATLAGIALQFTELQEEEPYRIGQETRMFAGNLASTVRGEKRQWTGTLLRMSEADRATLRSAIANDAHVAWVGDATGGATLTVRARITGARYAYEPDGTHTVVVTISIAEV